MADPNPYKSPVIPESPRNTSLRLIILLVVVIGLAPPTIGLSGLISYVAMQAFAKAATNSQPTTDPVIIIVACSIFFVAPAATLWGMVYWICTIINAIGVSRRRSNPAQQKDPGQS